MAGYYNPNFGQDYLSSVGIGPQYLNTNEKNKKQQGIAPPSGSQPEAINSWSDLGNQIAKPLTDQYNSFMSTANNLSNAGSQLAKGNVLGAVNSARGVSPMKTSLDTPTPTIQPAAPEAVDFNSSLPALPDLTASISSSPDLLSGGTSALAGLSDGLSAMTDILFA